jgi:hypothetical protein
VLFEALGDDPYVWVRYGAIRSLVEIALTKESLRRYVFTRLRDFVQSNDFDEQVAEEFARAVDLSKPVPGWIEAVQPVLELLWSKAKSQDEYERWRTLGSWLRVKQEQIDVAV